MFFLGVNGDAFRVRSREWDVRALRSRAMWALLGFVVYAIRQQRPRLPHAAPIAQFVFHALGLPGWAAHVVTPQVRFGAPVG